MAKHREKRRAQRKHEEVPHARRRDSRCNTHDQSSSFSGHQPWKSIPRKHRSRPFQPLQSRNSLPAADPRRRRQTAPADHHSTRSRQRSKSGLPGPHPSGSASLHNPATAEETDSPPSTHRAHPTFLNPDLASTHRNLKRQGISLISSLEKLVATLEALEPDPEEMEWISTGTVCYVPYQFPAQNVGQAVPEVEAEALSRAKIVAGVHVQYPTSPLPQQGASDVRDLGPVEGPTGDLFAGGAPTPASWPTVAGRRDNQVADLDARPFYCPDSCFCEEMWDRMP